VCREKKKRKSHPTRAWDKGKGKAEIERVPQSAFFAILQDALLFAPYFIRNRTGLGNFCGEYQFHGLLSVLPQALSPGQPAPILVPPPSASSPIRKIGKSAGDERLLCFQPGVRSQNN